LEKVTFELFGLTLLEPLSTLMNWVLASLCGILYTRLKGSEDPFKKYWSWFFLAYSISLVFGGFSHLLFEYVDMPGKIPGWSIAILGGVAAEYAMTLDVSDSQKRQMLINVIRSKFFATLILLIMDFSFKWVMVHTAGFFVFVGVLSYQRMKAGATNYKYFLQGMAFLFVMAGVKVAGLDIHPSWFTRDDIAHFLMLAMYWLFYKGVKNYQAQS